MADETKKEPQEIVKMPAWAAEIIKKQGEMEAELQLTYILRGLDFGKNVYMTNTLEESLHKMTLSFFELMQKKNLESHFLERVENNLYLARRWENIKNNVEE